MTKTPRKGGELQELAREGRRWKKHHGTARAGLGTHRSERGWCQDVKSPRLWQLCLPLQALPVALPGTFTQVRDPSEQQFESCGQGTTTQLSNPELPFSSQDRHRIPAAPALLCPPLAAAAMAECTHGAGAVFESQKPTPEPRAALPQPLPPPTPHSLQSIPAGMGGRDGLPDPAFVQSPHCPHALGILLPCSNLLSLHCFLSSSYFEIY